MKIFTNLFEFLDPFIPSLKGIYLAYSLDIAHNSNAPRKHYLLKVNNRNIRKGRLICSELTTKTPERCQWRRFAVFTVNFEHISNLYLALDLTQDLFYFSFEVLLVQQLRNFTNKRKV